MHEDWGGKEEKKRGRKKKIKTTEYSFFLVFKSVLNKQKCFDMANSQQQQQKIVLERICVSLWQNACGRNPKPLHWCNNRFKFRTLEVATVKNLYHQGCGN